MSEKLRIEAIIWLFEKDWEHHVTLTFSRDFPGGKKHSGELATKELELFARKLKNRVYGKKSKKKVEKLPIMEYTSAGRPHFHILFAKNEKMSESQFKELILDFWEQSPYTKVGHLRNGKNPDWFQNIDGETAYVLLDYLTKTLNDYSKQPDPKKAYEERIKIIIEKIRQKTESANSEYNQSLVSSNDGLDDENEKFSSATLNSNIDFINFNYLYPFDKNQTVVKR